MRSDWAILLRGIEPDDDIDLEALELLQSPHWRIERPDKRTFRLRSPHFVGLTFDQISAESARMIAEINAAARLLLHGYDGVRIVGLTYVGEGSGPIAVVGRPALWRLPIEPYPDVDLGDGNTLLDDVGKAAGSEYTADVLRYLSVNELDWIHMPKLIEMVQADEDVNGKIVQMGWISERELSRLKRTAQDDRIVGDRSRHASFRGDPIADPFTIAEARTVVMRLVRRYIAYKAGLNLDSPR